MAAGKKNFYDVFKAISFRANEITIWIGFQCMKTARNIKKNMCIIVYTNEYIYKDVITFELFPINKALDNLLATCK